MRDFKQGDMVLLVNDGEYPDDAKLKKGKPFKIDSISNRWLIVGGITAPAYRFILAETDSIDRALEHVQKDMWIETNDGIFKVQWVDINSAIGKSFFTIESDWIDDITVKKIYFYNPSVNEQQEELKANIARIEKELDDMKSKLS